MSLMEKFASRFTDDGFTFSSIARTEKTFIAVMVNHHGVTRAAHRLSLTGSLTPEQERARTELKARMIEEFIRHVTDPENTDHLTASRTSDFLATLSMRGTDGRFEYVVDHADLIGNAGMIRDGLEKIYVDSDNSYVRVAARHNLRAVNHLLNPSGFFHSLNTLLFD